MNLFQRSMYYLAGRPQPQVSHRPPMRSFRDFYSGVTDRLTASFGGATLSVNESLKRDLDKMRHRSRTLVNDNDYGKKFVSMVKTNVVGAKGIRLQARAKGSDGKPDKVDNKAIEASWKDFSKLGMTSACGTLSMLDVQRLFVAAVATEGECFIRFVYRAVYKYGVALQLVEADRFDTQLNRERTVDSSRIVMSIEMDDFDRPIAYYMLVSHPSESAYTINGNKYERVLAADMIHLFSPERIAQARGIPWMHASIRRINMIGGYEEAELVASRAGASKMGFYYTETGEEYKGDGEDAQGNLVSEAEPGTFEQLPHGTKFETYDPQHPTGAYNYFMRGVLKGAAAGLNVSYTGLSGDLEAVNYSSIRTGLIEERENWRILQGWVIEHAMGRIYERFLSGALSRGLIVNQVGVKLPLSKKEKFLEVVWRSRGWSWIDPVKDQQANDAAVAAGHKTNESVVSAAGDDLEEVYEQLQYEKQLAADYGLDFTPQTGKKDDEEDLPAGQDKNKKTSD